jgi:HEAT repeat protein
MSIRTQETDKPPCSLLRRFLVGFLFLVWVFGAMGGGVSETKSGTKTEGVKVTIELLEQQIDQLSGDARETARRLGKAAIPTLLKRFQSERTRERALVVECFGELKGDEAVRVLVQALQDPEADVWNTALDLLHKTNSPMAIGPLTDLLSQSPQARVRGEIARILGGMGAMSALPAIRAQAQKERDPETAHKMDLAMARLGDEPARERVAAGLLSSSPRIRYQAIGELEYVGDPRLISKLKPLLNDETRVINIGVEQWPVWHRVCDRAVEVIVALSGKTLPFPTGKRTYTKEQIQQVRELII